MRIFGFSDATRQTRERSRHRAEDSAERDVMQQQIDRTREQLEFIKQEARYLTRAEGRHGSPRRSH